MRRNPARRFILALVSGVAIMVGCNPSPSPLNSSDSATRVFEMRTYTAHPGKLAELERRFRDHTADLFEEHGMTNIGYWVPRDSAGENTLVYILAYPSREDADRMWAAFRADPAWIAARTASEEDGPLIEKIVSIFLDPTDFSPLR